MRFTKAKSDFLLDKYIEEAEKLAVIEREGKTYIHSGEWNGDWIHLTKKQLSNTEILRDIVAKGATSIIGYADNSVLNNFDAMEQFVEQNVRTFAYFDYNNARNCTPGQLDEFITKTITSEPIVVLDRMNYIENCEYDKNCDVILSNKKYLEISLFGLATHQYPIDIIDNPIYSSSYKQTYADFLHDNPRITSSVINEINNNKYLDIRFDDKNKMKKIINDSFNMGKLSY